MNFNLLAAYYHRLELLFAGGLMQRCRVAHLPLADSCQRALLVGEGTGRFLTELLRFNPRIQVTVVEHSAGMIEQARHRLASAGLDVARVEFLQLDVLDWKPPEPLFDLVVTNFFLDCFRAEQLARLIPQLAGRTVPTALWLLADFRVPERGWRRWRAQLILGNLYLFFKLFTALPARWLTPPDAFLRAAGFELKVRRCFSFDFAHADVWRRNGGVSRPG